MNNYITKYKIGELVICTWDNGLIRVVMKTGQCQIKGASLNGTEWSYEVAPDPTSSFTYTVMEHDIKESLGHLPLVQEGSSSGTGIATGFVIGSLLN